MYEIYAVNDSGEHLEARRSGLRAAFAVARKLWREHRGTAEISVRYDGWEIERDITQMSLSRKKQKSRSKYAQHPIVVVNS